MENSEYKKGFLDAVERLFDGVFEKFKCCGNCTNYRATKDNSNNEHYCKIKGDSWEAFDCCSDWELR